MPLIGNQKESSRFWTVWAAGSISHRQFGTQQEAIDEADRLANAHQGRKFHVLEHVGFSQVLIPSSFSYVSE